ncbi:NIPSNAP family protein [Sphingobium nicotianae]|uniref:NIPSNAP family protein n=1 Tax=Sphingobium nicotianae TaxID=2782607 RepID=A0A9X1ISM2_9SPHN|nr:NIPSNAP family protein [Sphingobium nicotianae]MBT2188638.1 NIPSNAP family protein [Sphingobium nicotianae]
MITELRTYTLAFGTTARYFDHYRELGQAPQWRILGNPVGYYTTEVGPLNQVVHLWSYSSFEDRMARRAALWNDAAWLKFIEAIKPIVVAQESRLMVPARLDGVAAAASSDADSGRCA